MPTFCGLAGYEPDGQLQWDGQDVWPFLTGKATRTEARSFSWRTDDRTAVREGDWKLIVPVRGSVELFDLRSDPYERNNLAAERPEKSSQLRALLAHHHKLDNRQLLPFIPKANSATN